jgi:hypothetical protein
VFVIFFTPKLASFSLDLSVFVMGLARFMCITNPNLILVMLHWDIENIWHLPTEGGLSWKDGKKT